MMSHPPSLKECKETALAAAADGIAWICKVLQIEHATDQQIATALHMVSRQVRNNEPAKPTEHTRPILVTIANLQRAFCLSNNEIYALLQQQIEWHDPTFRVTTTHEQMPTKTA